jgi:hypothetical protein
MAATEQDRQLSLPDELAEIERLFCRAVDQAIADAHAAGLSAFQAEDGYLIALQPDGKKRRLYRLLDAARRTNGAAASGTRRP